VGYLWLYFNAIDSTATIK